MSSFSTNSSLSSGLSMPPPPPHGHPAHACNAPSCIGDFHTFTTISDNPPALTEDILAHVCHMVMAHYSTPLHSTHLQSKAPSTKPNAFHLAAGLRQFGVRREDVVTKELLQFNVMNMFMPLDPSTLILVQCKAALASLIFLTEKQTGKIKARACANGKPQCEHIAKEETAQQCQLCPCSHCCSQTCTVATLDLPGAFLHADNDSFVVMKMTGKLAELMVKTDPTLYCKYGATTKSPIWHAQKCDTIL